MAIINIQTVIKSFPKLLYSLLNICTSYTCFFVCFITNGFLFKIGRHMNLTLFAFLLLDHKLTHPFIMLFALTLSYFLFSTQLIIVLHSQYLPNSFSLMHALVFDLSDFKAFTSRMVFAFASSLNLDAFSKQIKVFLIVG